MGGTTERVLKVRLLSQEELQMHGVCSLRRSPGGTCSSWYALFGARVGGTSCNALKHESKAVGPAGCVWWGLGRRAEAWMGLRLVKVKLGASGAWARAGLGRERGLGASGARTSRVALRREWG